MLVVGRWDKKTKKQKQTNQKRAKAQQLITTATSTKALLFQSKQVFYLLEQEPAEEETNASRRTHTRGW